MTTLELLTAASDAGDPAAMNSLDVLHVMGTQVQQDFATVLLWSQKAIDVGSSDAMSNLPTMWLRGIGVPRDFGNAFRWFDRFRARGNVLAAYITAVMADEGLGARRDAKPSRALFRKAAEPEFVPAMMMGRREFPECGILLNS